MLKIIKDNNRPLVPAKSITVEVGFFKNSIYPNGKSVASVARVHNDGIGYRKRPFFTTAMKNLEQEIPKYLIKIITQKIKKDNDFVFTNSDILKIGVVAKQEVQKQILIYKVIDTGFMRSSVKYKIKPKG